jgi:hypothetical protein
LAQLEEAAHLVDLYCKGLRHPRAGLKDARGTSRIWLDCGDAVRYPGQALIVATVLALPPYFLIRGLTNRFVTWRLRSAGETRSKL